MDLFSAKAIGSPSVPALTGKRSISSHNKTRIGLDAKSLGEFAPTTTISPPGNFLCNVLLSPSLALGSATLSASSGVSLIIGASLSLDQSFAIGSLLGTTTIIAEGSWCM